MDSIISVDPVFVFMNNDGEILRVEVNKTLSIKMLRTRIEDDCGIPFERQCFTCDDERAYSKEALENEDIRPAVFDKESTHIAAASEGNDITPTKTRAETQNNDSGCHDMVNEAEQGENGTKSRCINDTFITVKNKDGKEAMIVGKESETVETLMLKVQDECGLSWDRQSFTCFDERTLSAEFWENENKKLFAHKECGDDLAQSFGELDLNNRDVHDDESYLNETTQDVYDTDNNNSEKPDDGEEETIQLDVQTMHAISDTVCYADGKAVDLIKDRCKFVLQEELSATKNSASSPNAVSSLIPKISECKIEILSLYRQTLSFSEYKFLTASGTIQWLSLTACTIEAGFTVTVDKLFDNLLRIVKFEMHCSNNSSWFESDTVKKMVKIISRYRKMQFFGLHGLPETFDITSLTVFILRNSTIDIRLGYSIQLSPAYKKILDNFINNIVMEKPKRIPRLQFPGSDDAKYAEYDKLYCRQK